MIEVTSEGGTGAVVIVDPVNEGLPYTFTDLAAGNYPVTIEDETGCQTSASADIIEPSQVFIDITGTTEIGCGGDCDGTVQFETGGGTGDLTVLFNNEDLDPNALCAGEYMALSCDLNGCCDSSMFEIVQPDPIEILTDITPVTCTGMNDGMLNVFPIGGIGPLTWEATDLEGEEIDLNNLFEGEYFITASDSTGCSTDTTVVVFAAIVTDMEITIFTSPVTCWDAADGTATAAVTGGNLPISYQWTDPLSQITATAVGLTEDVYNVTITDAIGCTLSEFAEVEPTIGCFFIATALTPNGDGFNDEWIVGGLEYFPQAVVQVFNRWGQLLFESKGYSTRWDGTWDGNLLPVADYYFVITYDENQDPITGAVTIKY
jgi:gliding motility-associated-like protein